MDNIAVLFKRSRDILKGEGLSAATKRIFDYVSTPFFKLEYFYIYEHSHEGLDESRFLSKIEGLTCKIVKSNDEADALAVEVGTDFRKYIINSKKRLNKGGIAFCFFNSNELVHVGWIATDAKSKKAVDGRPYEVDFANYQACTGGSFTPPKYRGKGLMIYGYYKRFEYLKEQGYTSSRSVTSVTNDASNKVHAKFNPKILGKARHFRLLWWESWREM